MALTAKTKGNSQDFDPIEEGMHHAICYAVYDLGHHLNEKFNKSEHKCVIVWELPEERIEINGEDLPRAKSRVYTVSLHDKADLKRDLESWRGKSFTEKEKEGFDIFKLLKVNCTLQILHKKKDDKTYANIVSIVPLMKGMQKKEPENPVRRFSFEEGGNIPDGTPDWIVDYIKQSDEWGNEQPQGDDINMPWDNNAPDF